MAHTLSESSRQRRRLPEERPQQILDAAFAVFGEHGLAGARLEDIARRAGIAKGTIYLYFPNKEALFKEMVRSTMIARIAEAEQNVAADVRSTATSQLLAYGERWWAFLCGSEFQAIYRLIIGELHRFPELAEFYAREAVLRSQTLLQGILRRGIERGEFRAHDVHVSSRALASMLVSNALWVSQPDVFRLVSPIPADQLRDQLLAFFLSSIAAAPVSPAAAGVHA